MFQLQWAGHSNRMPGHSLPKCIFYGELANGVCSVGGQKMRQTPSKKDSKTATLMSTHGKSLPKNGQPGEMTRCWTFEAPRTSKAMAKGGARNQQIPAEPQEDIITCLYCDRCFKARIGLISHQNTEGSIVQHCSLPTTHIQHIPRKWETTN